MCDYEIVEKNKAGIITREATKVRCYNDDGETLFCARDLFTLCKVNSVDGAIKRMEKYIGDDPKVKIMLVRFPFCSRGAGWRTTNTYFINEYAFRLYMRGRYIQKDVKEWLVSDVFTFKFASVCEIADDKQIGLSEHASEANLSDCKNDNVLELGKLLEKNGAIKLKPAQGYNSEELDEAVGKMVLAMLDVMKILVTNRSSAMNTAASEKMAS